MHLKKKPGPDPLAFAISPCHSYAAGNQKRIVKKKNCQVPRSQAKSRPTKLHPHPEYIVSRPRTFPAARRRISVVAASRKGCSPDSSILVAPVLQSTPCCHRFRFRSEQDPPDRRSAVDHTHRPMAPAARAGRWIARCRISAVDAVPIVGLDFDATLRRTRSHWCCCCCCYRR